MQRIEQNEDLYQELHTKTSSRSFNSRVAQALSSIKQFMVDCQVRGSDDTLQGENACEHTDGRHRMRRDFSEGVSQRVDDEMRIEVKLLELRRPACHGVAPGFLENCVSAGEKTCI